MEKPSPVSYLSIDTGKGRGDGDQLLTKTGPAVKLDSEAQTKGERTKARVMDLAYEAIMEKGFAATSIEELVEAAGITKSGFFYHFKDKNDLARQLYDRFLREDEGIAAWSRQ